MIKNILVLFTLLGLAAVASAKSYSITLYEPSVIGGAELKPGDYRLELKNEKVVIKKGKQMGEAPAMANITSRKSTSAAPT